ncbi:polysaccharide biosynthesis protein [Nocardioides sp. BP30]|uniref:lipopolysaccharide biosynthesis protein n=1 Tax=Nocardioides sp. BP30 TaxID=3036374 RepID=UPI00246961D0|nr:polysaccharide biosynthesis protein [Nocardioides sp. BP30]WGL53911.1 polysaccharide biosynthesis protein [Nocardioides sp. BP30]
MTVTAPPSGRSRLLSFFQGSGGLAIAIVVMNVATYGFQIAAARRLGPEQYGGVASLMALLLVIGVVQLGLQATAARRIAAAPDHIASIERTIKTVSLRGSLVVGAIMLVASPLVWHLLQLDSIVPALLVAVVAVPLTMIGGQAGMLQGERRWLPLSLLYLGLGIPRLLVGTVCILIRPSETSAMVGVTLAAFVPVVVGWWALRHPRPDASPAGAQEHSLRNVVNETVRSSTALLAFFVLSNLDIVIARNTLSHHQAGLYAGGLIMTKAVLFLPQFVVVVAFPSMSTEGSQRSALMRSLVAVGIVGVASTLGAWLLSGLAMIFVGGASYSGVQHRLWLFAVVGTLLAMLQMLVYGVLARQHRGASLLVWVAAVALTLVGITMGSLTHLVLVVVVVDAILTAVLLVLSLRHLQDETPAAVA